MTDVAQLGEVRVESLLDLDPDLAELIPEDDRDRARRAAVAHTIGLPDGNSEVLRTLGTKPDISGFLIVEGLALREVGLDSKALPDLLGPGDVLGPPVTLTSFLPLTHRLAAIAPTRVAILGASFARLCGHWPPLLTEIERRKAAERERLAVHGAILQLGRVEIRLLAVLWHLAGTWGRVSAEGVVLPFALTHEMLGLFVGAERPTVTLASGELSDAGLVDRLPDRTWLLREGSNEWLRRELGETAEMPSALSRARSLCREAEPAGR